MSDGDRRAEHTRATAPDPAEDPAGEELAVRTIELDAEDGGTVVIAQQNQAGRRQSGGGEYKNVDHAPSVEEAAAEQELVDASTDAPHAVDDHDPDDPALDAVDEPNRERSTDTTAWQTDAGRPDDQAD